MRSRASFFLFLFLFLMTGCGDPLTVSPSPSQSTQSNEEDQVETGAQFRGLAEIEQIVSARLFDSTQSGFLAHYLGSINLGNLLGQSFGSGLESGFENGNPNALNLLAWQLVIRGLALEVANTCNEPFKKAKSLPFNSDFFESLLPICGWPSAEATSEPHLFAFWTQLLQYDAPITHFAAWRDYFTQGRISKEETRSNVVADLVFGALFNPYFLLER